MRLQEISRHCRYVDYMCRLLEPLERQHTIRHCVKHLKLIRKRYPFETIAFSGNSGALIAPTIADRIQCGLTLVRKPGVASHSALEAEGCVNLPYIILDDLINTGETINRIRTALRPELCVGIFLYEEPVDEEYMHHAEHNWKGVSFTFTERVFANSIRETSRGRN